MGTSLWESSRLTRFEFPSSTITSSFQQPVGSGFEPHWRLHNRLSCPRLAALTALTALTALKTLNLKPSFQTLGRPHHWVVTPSLGKCGQIGSSMHYFVATPPFPNLSTPLDSLIFPRSDVALEAKIGSAGGRECRKNGM